MNILEAFDLAKDKGKTIKIGQKFITGSLTFNDIPITFDEKNNCFVTKSGNIIRAFNIEDIMSRDWEVVKIKGLE